MDGFEIRSLYKYFPKYIGQQLVDNLAGDNPDANLLEKAAPAWIVLTFLESIPFLDVVSTNTGFGVVRTNSVAPASKERVESIRLACQSAANDYIDILLQWLETNVSDYGNWNKSSLNEGSLIPTAAVFDQFIDINMSRYKFVNLKRTINQIELTSVAETISPEFLAELQVGSDTNVKPLFQRALAYHSLALFEKMNDPLRDVKYWLTQGDIAFSKAMAYLKNHLADYPVFAEYGYEAPYDNETDGEESGFFIAGATA